jgi:adenylate kinase family enzyme
MSVNVLFSQLLSVHVRHRSVCLSAGFRNLTADIEGENGGARMYLPPLLPPPECESKLITRSDDTEEVVKERLRVYHDLVGSDCMRLPFDSFSLLGIF